MTVRLVSVAVPVPYLPPLTYAVPDGHEQLPPIGGRVRVPVGTRTLVGCVVAHDADPVAGTGARAIAEIIDREPVLPASIVTLCRWVSEYYLAGIGDAIGVAMPPGARRRASGFKTRRVAAITVHGLAVLSAGADGPAEAGPHEPSPSDAGPNESPAAGEMRLTTGQRQALDALAQAPAGLPLGELRDRGITGAVLGRLVKRGLATIREERDERDPFPHAVGDAAASPVRQLTVEQTSAMQTLADLADAGSFRVALLHGVTGSGKTEIYLRLADRVRRSGKQVLLMVPEIALTSSVTAQARAAFGERVAIQHSALSDGERHDQWQRIRRGEIDVVVGTRSAVFAPLQRLGLVIVDEEHDSSYKQEETPRYNGRDVAIVRGSHEQALVVLGSATPSMETFQNTVTGKYVRVTLDRRVMDRPLAAVRLVNMRQELADEGPDAVISRELATAIESCLSRQEQALVLLNRRGFSTAVFCRQCGDTFECPNCSVSLTVHGARRGWKGQCHYCNYATAMPQTCRKCAAPYLEHAGFGTEKVEQQLRQRFPDARIARVDRDAVRRKGALTSLLGSFAAGEIDVLVGTQMIAKGHDFPRVTLVGVISADVGLGLADFRASERTFQLLTQVAGRAGRGERAGAAIIQTLYPEHYSIQLACRQAYPAFFDREISFRKEMLYPPLVAMINVVVRGRSSADASNAASDIVRQLETTARAGNFVVLGPAPAPLERLRGEHRAQVFLKGTRRADMRAALEAALQTMPELRRRVSVDVDPLNVL